MAATAQNDALGSVKNTGFSTGWDWKGEYVSSLSEEGYERFSQYSATPDTTILFAGPARFTGLAGDTGSLLPIGLADGINYSSDAQLARLYEIGSNRAFFTRGKTISAISFSKMLADQQNILRALTLNAYRPVMNVDGTKAPGADSPNPDIMMNLDSEYFSVPFGLLMVFKTRGGGAGTGKILSALYLENCMFAGYNFNVTATAPVIVEGISIQFDRPVPVSFSN
jgi:hypothetical protein